MSKWRPSDNCLYVIPDIHGMLSGLELILSRILPLRHTGGHLDTLVFLGDYVDRRIEAHRVVDLVKDVKSDFPDQVFCLFGNHELMLLQAVLPGATPSQYNMWMGNGGEETILGYFQRIGSELENPYLTQRQTLTRFIPDDHIEFFKSLLPYYETDDYIFVHGGCDPFVPLDKQNWDALACDRSVYCHVTNLAENNWECPWKKTIVTGHNGEEDGKPFVHDKFMMLDGSYAEKVYVWELNSRTGFSARKNKKRLVKESIT